MPPKAKAGAAPNVKVMEDADRDKYLHEIRKNWLREKAAIEQKNSKYNLSRIQESWLKIMRSAKTKQLKREVEIIAQNHERDVDRKDAILQMLDRDIDEAEEQHQVAIRTHLQNIDTLLEIQRNRLESLEQDFLNDVGQVEDDWKRERKELTDSATEQQQELVNIIQEVSNQEKAKEQLDISEHQSQYELIRNKNIEEDHQMRSSLEERIESMKDKCNAALQAYRVSTETNTSDYRSFLGRDASLSKHVEKKLRQVERMQSNIVHWKQKIQQNRQECEERNSHLRSEKEHLVKHFQELKQKMNKFRDEERKRLTELTVNGRDCTKKLKEHLTLGEGIIKLAEQCRRFETEREKVIPFYQGTALESEDVDLLPNETLEKYISEFQERAAAENKAEKEKLEKQKMNKFFAEAQGQQPASSSDSKPDQDGAASSPSKQQQIQDQDAAGEIAISDDGIDDVDEYQQIKDEMKQVLEDEKNQVHNEWNYLDTFFKRYNKVHLDVLAIQKEKHRLKTENTQLRSILKQFLDGVAVNEEVLSKANPLFVVNGRVNLNYVPPKREPQKKVVIEAAHHVGKQTW